MRTCENCRSTQFDGTIFCTECGASLLPPARGETTANLKFTVPDLPSAPVTPASDPAITIVVLKTGQRIRLDMHDELLIGRKDERRGIFPDLDLGAHGGFDAGVSRRHAILSYRDGRYWVEDLGSANGTYINGHRVESEAPASIAHGDELTCGAMPLRVEMR